jgi:predicted HAD superfamily phosphohydrolase YqeG
MNLPVVRVVFFDLGETLVRTADRSWVPGAKAALAPAQAAGLRVGVISNTGTLTRAQLTAALPADFDWGAFDPGLVILSAEVGAEKPSPRIFLAAAAAAGVPSECLFCTEDLADALAAQRAGLLAARVQKSPHSDVAELLTAAARVGVLPASALRALGESTRALNAAHAPTPDAASSTPAPSPSVEQLPPDDSEGRAYYRMLEQTGQLLDVASDTDLAALPPRVTHVRWPNGTVERVGFSAT